ASSPPNERSDSKVLTKSTTEKAAGPSLARNWTDLSPGGHVFVGLPGFLRPEPDFVQFPVKRRAADAQPARDFGHLPAIARDGEANHLGFELFQRPHIAGGVEQRQGVLAGRRRDVLVRARGGAILEDERRRGMRAGVLRHLVCRRDR